MWLLNEMKDSIIHLIIDPYSNFLQSSKAAKKLRVHTLYIKYLHTVQKFIS